MFANSDCDLPCAKNRRDWQKHRFSASKTGDSLTHCNFCNYEISIVHRGICNLKKHDE